MRMTIYALSGLAVGQAGVVLASMDQSGIPQTTGDTDFITIIAAVVLGGTSLSGGRGRMIGTFLGVALFGIITNGLDLLGVQPFWQTFISGIVLLAAVGLDAIRRREVSDDD